MRDGEEIFLWILLREENGTPRITRIILLCCPIVKKILMPFTVPFRFLKCQSLSLHSVPLHPLDVDT